MKNYVTYKGIIHFDPVNKTKKHELQADWKRMAMVLIDGEVCEYYSWFIENRYGLKLNKPLRNAHISFINDSINDIKKGTGLITDEEVDVLWETVRTKWDNKEIEVVLDLDVRGDSKHYWLNIPQEERELLHSVRAELGLSRPFFGLHMTIGIIRPGINQEQAIYIQRLLANGFIQ